ncbi:MAG: hypothetical protein N4A72_12640 [Bacteroidales bacterium]|jgi:hypothetical protein|nr:hypothetical protein [Bacteroidales bacterium]
MKIIKFIGKAIGILLLLIIILLFAIPYFFKGELLELAKKEINKSVDAEVEFLDFDVSIFSSFPDLTLQLEDLSVVGKNKFAGDTLVTFKSFDVSVDLMSAVKGESIKVKRVSLKQPILNGKVLEDGSANWDIAKKDTVVVAETKEVAAENTTETEGETASEEPMELNVSLKHFEIVDATINYNDKVSGTSAVLKNLNFALNGDFSMANTDLNLDLSIENVLVGMAGINYLNNAAVDFDAVVSADMVNSVYELKDNRLAINDLVLAFGGKFEIGDPDMKIDLNLHTVDTKFKTVLSLVPYIYLKDFQDLKTSGELALNVNVSGVYNDKVTPSVDLSFKVLNGMFSYPDLPKNVNDINIDLKVDWNGENNDASVVNLERFYFVMAGNPFNITANVKTIMSDPSFWGGIKGDIDFASLKDVIPLDSMSIDGRLKADVSFGGKQSYLDSEQYDKFHAKGSVVLSKFKYLSPDLPEVDITRANLVMTSKTLTLKEFNAFVGDNDFSVTGEINDYITYATADGVLKGSVNLRSSRINVNDFMPSSDTPEEEKSEETSSTAEQDSGSSNAQSTTGSSSDVATQESGVAQIPENLNLKVNADIDSIFYDNLEIANLNGYIAVKDGVASMKNLSMDLLEGSVVVTGAYDAVDINKPRVDVGLKVNELDIKKTAETFNTVKSFVPVAKSCTGKFSMNADFTTLLNAEMSPVNESIVANGVLKLKKAGLKNSKLFGAVADALKNDKYRELVLNNVTIKFSIVDGRLYVDPFKIPVGKGDVTVSGDQGLDMTMNYLLSLRMPRSEFGSGVNNLVDGLLKDLPVKVSDDVKLNGKVTGTVDKPKVKLVLGKGDGKPSAKGKAKEEINKKIDKEIEDLLKKAQQDSDKIKADARKEADKAIQQAMKEADKLIEKADNPLLKVAAKASAKKLKEAAQKEADKIIEKADVKANKIMEDANKKAEAKRKQKK